jgi:hypothetical protein
VIALVDYGAGNLTSVRKALAAIGANTWTPAVAGELGRAHGIIVQARIRIDFGIVAIAGDRHSARIEAVQASVGGANPPVAVFADRQRIDIQRACGVGAYLDHRLEQHHAEEGVVVIGVSFFDEKQCGANHQKTPHRCNFRIALPALDVFIVCVALAGASSDQGPYA